MEKVRIDTEERYRTHTHLCRTYELLIMQGKMIRDMIVKYQEDVVQACGDSNEIRSKILILSDFIIKDMEELPNKLSDKV